jgi:hypothetical protein
MLNIQQWKTLSKYLLFKYTSSYINWPTAQTSVTKCNSRRELAGTTTASGTQQVFSICCMPVLSLGTIFLREPEPPGA